MPLKSKRVELLEKASAKLNKILDLRELLSLILMFAKEGLNTERGTIYLVDREKNEIWSEIFIGDEIKEIRLKIGTGISGQVAQTGKTIYAEDAAFYEEGYGHYEMLHEYTFLYTEAQELYFVLAILGVEYTLNMGVPDISRYLEWLSQHGNMSPLYR